MTRHIAIGGSTRSLLAASVKDVGGGKKNLRAFANPDPIHGPVRWLKAPAGAACAVSAPRCTA